MEQSKTPITERVKTFEDACTISTPSEDMKILFDYKGQDKDLLAAQGFAKMNHITKVLNEKWEANWKDSDERKFYPWFDMSPESGSALAYYDSYYGNSGSVVGSRLVFKSSDLAKYAATQFIDIYKQFLTI